MTTKISSDISALLGEGAASHASIEVKVTGNPSQIQRAFRHLSKGGKKALSKASVKTDVKKDEPEEPAEDVRESVTPRDFANQLLDS